MVLQENAVPGESVTPVSGYLHGAGAVQDDATLPGMVYAAVSEVLPGHIARPMPMKWIVSQMALVAKTNNLDALHVRTPRHPCAR